MQFVQELPNPDEFKKEYVLSDNLKEIKKKRDAEIRKAEKEVQKLEDEINNLDSESIDTAAAVMKLLKKSEYSKEQNYSITKCWNRLAKE